MRLSASKMNTFMTCQLQAKFRYVDRLPSESNARAAFGSCVHHALEIYNTSGGDVSLAVQAFRESWNDPESIGSGFTYWPRYSTFGGLMIKGTDIVREYHEKQRWEKRRVVAAEHRFLVPFGAHELTGMVDLLETKKSSKGQEVLRTVDYKTNSRQPSSPELRVNLQFSVYLYASLQPEFWLGNGADFPPMANGDFYWETLKSLPRRAIWYHLQSNKEVDAGDRSDKDFMRLYRVADEIERALKYEVFMPNISADSCLLCPYTEPCGIEIPTEEAMREEESSF